MTDDEKNDLLEFYNLHIERLLARMYELCEQYRLEEKRSLIKAKKKKTTDQTTPDNSEGEYPCI